MSEQAIYLWWKRFGTKIASDTSRRRMLEEERPAEDAGGDGDLELEA